RHRPRLPHRVPRPRALPARARGEPGGRRAAGRDGSPLAGWGAMTPVLAVDDLEVTLRAGEHEAVVLDGVTLTVDTGETVALVGESGAGKAVLALAVMGLLPDAMRVRRGQIRLHGVDLVTAPDAVVRAKRGGEMAMVFQDPQSSLH